MFKKILITSVGMVFLGCGADSDLLRDDSATGGKPTGSAYEILENKVYRYQKVGEFQLGFDYLSLNEECREESCNLLRDNYLLFNGESKKLPLESKLVLSSNGWYEKSKDEECQVSFSGSKITKRCPDGTEQVIEISKENLEGISLVDELNTTGIEDEVFKDPDATFTHDSMHYIFKMTNSQKVFEMVNGDDSKCYTSVEMRDPIEKDVNLSHSSTIVCRIDGMKLILNGADKPLGSFMVEGSSDQGSWKKRVVFENYSLIELNVSSIENNEYAIASYNDSVYIGRVIEKEQQKTYLNTEAFNVVYTQLHDAYRGISESYQKLKENYFSVAYNGGIKAYKQFSVDDEDHLNIAYKSFDDGSVSANWILTKNGLKRESLVCDSAFYFHGYEYHCEDGREGVFSYLGEASLENELVADYLYDKNLNFPLVNRNRFFSVGARELRFKQKNLSAESYIFNLDGNYDIGESPLMDDASSFVSGELYVSSKERDGYLKLLGVGQGESGVVEIYELNSSLEDRAQILASAKKVEESSTWRRKSLGTKSIIEIANSSSVSSRFHNQNSIAMIEFLLRTPKIASGEKYEEAGEHEQRYLNANAYENILENTE